MDQTRIFGPFFATIFLTLAVWIYMYARRISFITRSGIVPGDLAVPGELARRSQPAVSNPSDNLKNLFEIPVLFYVLVLYLFATRQVDGVYVDAAWVFVVFRALHSAVHCTFNRVMLRFLSLPVFNARGVIHRGARGACVFRRLGSFIRLGAVSRVCGLRRVKWPCPFAKHDYFQGRERLAGERARAAVAR